MNQKLGIIAGGGFLPSEIANICSRSSRDFCIAALENEAEISLFFGYSFKSFSVGAVGGIIDYFTENAVKEIIIIGNITRPNLKSLKVDLAGSLLIAKILKTRFLGDDSVLKIISNFIESKGFKVIFPMKFMQNNNYYYQNYLTKYLPSNQNKIDIKLGIKVLDALGELDIGQSVIVCNGYVTGIEAAEGTDNLIKRCENFRTTTRGGVLIKRAKRTQDMRFDVPTIGPNTGFYLAKYGYEGAAVQKDGVIIVKPAETLEIFNKSGLFITYI